MKRRAGHGSITVLPDGRRWVRGPRRPDGTRPTLGYVDTDEAAETILAHGVALMATRKREVGQTFASLAASVLDERELEGLRGVPDADGREDPQRNGLGRRTRVEHRVASGKR